MPRLTWKLERRSTLRNVSVELLTANPGSQVKPQRKRASVNAVVTSAKKLTQQGRMQVRSSNSGAAEAHARNLSIIWQHEPVAICPASGATAKPPSRKVIETKCWARLCCGDLLTSLLPVPSPHPAMRRSTGRAWWESGLDAKRSPPSAVSVNCICIARHSIWLLLLDGLKQCSAKGRMKAQFPLPDDFMRCKTWAIKTSIFVIALLQSAQTG